MSNTHNEIHLLNSDGSTTPYGSTGGGGGGSSFTATIVVSYPEGTTCTCNGIIADVTPFTFVVHEANTYSVKVAKDSYEKTVPATVLHDGDEVALTITSIEVDGTTEEPNDVVTWLYCGDVYDKNYTTIEQVLADNATLVKIMASDNAVDYLVRSTAWVSDITASEAGMKAIGSSDYASDTLLTDSNWNTAICNSTYFEDVLSTKVPTMTSNTTPRGEAFWGGNGVIWSGCDAYKAFNGPYGYSEGWTINGDGTNNGYVGYYFNDALVSVHKVTMINRDDASGTRAPKTFIIQGSDDKTNWTDVSSVLTNPSASPAYESEYVLSNDIKYKYYRLFIKTLFDDPVLYYGIGELQFYGRSIGGVQDWLRAAGITDKSYTTLSEVLADSTTLAALMASEDAVDYLVTATAWASTICADSTAMSLIGLNNFAANTLLADSTWLEAICNSSYMESVLNAKVPTLTGYNGSDGGVCSASSSYDNVHYLAWKAFDGSTDPGYGTWLGNEANAWVQYMFNSSKTMYKLKVINCGRPVKGFIIKASNDGSNFTDLLSATLSTSAGGVTNHIITNTSAYKYWRFYISDNGGDNYAGVQELVFYGREDV